MSHQQFLDNWNTFYNLINEIHKIKDDKMSSLINRYTEQNIVILNEILAMSINHLNKLKSATSVNEMVCNQTQFTHEIGKKLSLAAQHFLNASLTNIADYNEWLKNQYDLATD